MDGDKVPERFWISDYRLSVPNPLQTEQQASATVLPEPLLIDVAFKPIYKVAYRTAPSAPQAISRINRINRTIIMGCFWSCPHQETVGIIEVSSSGRCSRVGALAESGGTPTAQYFAAAVQGFGKFSRMAYPGCNCLNPFCGERVAGGLSLRVQQLEVRCETKTKDNVSWVQHIRLLSFTDAAVPL